MAAASSLTPHSLRHEDGTVHFSDLKAFARSAMHYKHFVTSKRETTRAMRFGTIVDRLVFGTPLPPVWHGERRQGNEWKSFAARHAGKDIITQAEIDDAEPVARAVRADPVAQRYLEGRYQVQLEWEMQGVRCSTRGVDVVGDGWIGDLKVTNSDPTRFVWHARRMLWHAQLAFYEAGCAQNGIDTSKGLFLIGADSAAPHPVTVLRLTPRALEEGQKACHLWIEQLRACEASGAWPGYSQSVLDLDVDNGVELVGVEDEDEDESSP